MKKPHAFITISLALILLLSFCACGNSSSSFQSSVSAPAQTVSPAEFTSQPETAVIDADAVITLSGDTASCTGEGVSVSGGELTITKGGVFALTGTLNDGRIIVDAGDGEVTLIFSGASVSCSYSSPLFIYKCASCVVTLATGTENSLADGDSYDYNDKYSSELDEEPNACLYSKADLIINGGGSLAVTAGFNNGLTGKDTLTIQDASLSVSALNHGINGKDSNTIVGADITVVCGGDALRSTNATDGSLGWISIEDSVLTLNAGEDGIQAETTLYLDGSTADIQSGAKGIKGVGGLTVAGGEYTVTATDDALHTNGDAAITGGVFTLASDDDGVHADGTLAISGGELAITKSYEGLEGNVIEISGGTIYITASDDGINSAGGADSSGFGGFGGDMFAADDSCLISVTGGYTVINAGGDGVDSNGNVEMSAGTVVVFGPTDSGNGALDYNGTFTLTGGTLLAQGSSGMAQTPNGNSQYVISVTFEQTLEAGSLVCLESDGGSFVFQIEKAAQNLIFSSPEITEGQTYSISYGGEYTGSFTDGIGTGGEYTGGTVLGELTVSQLTSSYGQVGFGGSMGGGMMGAPGGFGGMDPGDMGGGFPGGNGGTMPDVMPSGMPSGGGTRPNGQM